MSQSTSPDARSWWLALEPQWQEAFNEGFFGKARTTEMPGEAELQNLLHSPAIRLIGPKGPYPNLSFELTNLSGVKQLSRLETLVVGFCQLSSLEALAGLHKLKALFLFGNALESLDGIQPLKNLEQLYANLNRISDIKPIKSLTNLREFYCNYNQLQSLEGLTKAHRKSMKKFVCLPNEELPDSEILKVERQLLIRCQQG